MSRTPMIDVMHGVKHPYTIMGNFSTFGMAFDLTYIILVGINCCLNGLYLNEINVYASMYKLN